MMLVERDHELFLLRRAFHGALAGHGQGILVTGPVATGKTRLLHTFAEEAVRQGALFLGASASQAERSLPLGVIGQLVRNAGLDPEATERVARLLHEGAFSALISDTESETSEFVPPHILHSLCMVLLGLAQRRPLVLAVDDMHHTDLPSLQCLSYLIRRLPTSRAMVVLTEASRLRPVHPHFEAEFLRQPHCRYIRLTPLSQQGVLHLLESRVGADAARGLAPAAHAVSGGNPLLVAGLIADRGGDGAAAGDDLTVGDGFGQALINCLYRSDLSMLKVVRGLAVLGGPSSVELLGQLVDLPEKLTATAVDALSTAGMLGNGWFRHPAASDAILDGMLPEERAAMHAHAARLLRGAGVPATTIARHLLAAGDTVSGWELPVLHDAAAQALADGRLELAASWLRLAHRSETDEAQRARTHAELGGIEWRINPSVAVMRVADLLAALRAGHLTGPEALAPVNWLLWFGRVDEALAALADVGRQDQSPATAEGLFATQVWLHALYPSARDRIALRMRTDSRNASALRSKAASMLADALRDGPTDALIALDQQMLTNNPLGGRAFGPVGLGLWALIWNDQLDLALRWCEPLLHEAETRHEPTRQALFSALRAEIALRQGDEPAAERYARTALAILPLRSWGVLIGAPLSTLLQALTRLGRFEEAMRELRVPVPDAQFQTTIGLQYLMARGRYLHATGNYATALADFQSCGKLMAKWDLELPALASWWSDAARSCLRLGRPRQARELVTAQLERLGPRQVRMRGVSLRVLAAASDLKQRRALLNEAVAALEACGDRQELAAALTELGQAQEALDDSRAAQLTLQWARKLAEKSGTVPQPRAAEAEDPPQPILVNLLSDAERRVALLVVEGNTNRQIADKLYVTVSTVEQHLTRIYRKLRVNRRADLRLCLESTLTE